MKKEDKEDSNVPLSATSKYFAWLISLIEPSLSIPKFIKFHYPSSTLPDLTLIQALCSSSDWFAY